MKQCAICKEQKELKEFYKDNRHKDGHYSICKKCHKDKVNNYKTTSLKDRYINKAIERASRKYPGVTFNKEEIYFMANEYCPRCGNKLSYGYNSKYSPTLIIHQDGSIAIICRTCRNI